MDIRYSISQRGKGTTMFSKLDCKRELILLRSVLILAILFLSSCQTVPSKRGTPEWEPNEVTIPLNGSDPRYFHIEQELLHLFGH